MSPGIALIGYGEVGQTLAADLCAAGMRELSAWDQLFPLAASAPSRAAARSGHVRPAGGMADALADRSLVICAVTAANCLAAAREAASSLTPGALYLDLNSVAPLTRRAAAAEIEAAGGRYVEAAVMSPIAPRRLASPMLIGGAHAAAFVPLARSLGFTGVQVFDPVLGRASAAKMCRSVLVKGLETLFTEALLAARYHGVETAVLDSLRDLFPGQELPSLARYLISRSLLHGRRRAEEMREAARTVAEAGIDPLMAAACAQRQDWASVRRPQTDPASLSGLLDAVLAAPGTPLPETA